MYCCLFCREIWPYIPPDIIYSIRNLINTIHEFSVILQEVGTYIIITPTIDKIIPGQYDRIHCVVSTSEPLHGFPFCCGVGSVHVRRRILSPVSQVVEQSDHCPHCDQPPSTKIMHVKTKRSRLNLYGESSYCDGVDDEDEDDDDDDHDHDHDHDHDNSDNDDWRLKNLAMASASKLLDRSLRNLIRNMSARSHHKPNFIQILLKVCFY